MFVAQHIPYKDTNFFSKIILDYLEGNSGLRPFYGQPVSMEGFTEAIRLKEKQAIQRDTLVNVLKDQYKIVPQEENSWKNIISLSSTRTFTICTAHQPNLFTGPIYFIYKILHAIKIAEQLKQHFPTYHFVPVYYMGSEDADLDELNHFAVDGKNYKWTAGQTGAVGRMIIDKKIENLAIELEQQLSVEQHGLEWMELIRQSYIIGSTIQQATFTLVNRLFGKYGLIVLIADDARLKRQMISVFESDLFHQGPSQIVEKTCKELARVYKVQANPREINLFYLKDNLRERIVKTNGHYAINGTDIKFTEEEIKRELHEHPERFSPNVILRGLYQETILPDLAFIGGGGEMAYWLQLKSLFENFKIAFPILVLRNSFLVVEGKWKNLLDKLGIGIIDIFESENKLMNEIVAKFSVQQVGLNGNFALADELYTRIEQQAGSVDPSLSAHVKAIRARSIKTLQALEKKMFRAEKRKFTDQQRQIQKLKNGLFPQNNLQERVENIAAFYAKWGNTIIEEIYKNSPGLEQEFTVLTGQIR